MQLSAASANPLLKVEPPADGRGAQMKMSCKHDARLAASTPDGVLELMAVCMMEKGNIQMPELFTLYKLIVLYMLEKVDFSMTNAQISEFILDRGYTDYFTLQSVIAELLENGMLRQETIQNCSYYSLTEAGEEALLFFQNRISAPIKEDIEQYLTQNKMKLIDEVSVIADYYKNTANEYSVRCLVKEKYSNPIDLTITVPDETQARMVCRKWKQKCQEIYGHIMKELL